VAVSVILHIGGDPQDLVADYDRGWALTPDAAEPGLIYHACLVLPNGIKIINHFATEAQARGFLGRADVEQTLAGLTLVDGAPAVVVLHAYSIPARATAAADVSRSVTPVDAASSGR
jgi:hypothetical protein